MKTFIKTSFLIVAATVGLTACDTDNSAAREQIVVNNRDNVVSVPPRVPVKTIEGRDFSVDNVVSEDQTIDKNPPRESVGARDEAIDSIDDLRSRGPGDTIPTKSMN